MLPNIGPTTLGPIRSGSERVRNDSERLDASGAIPNESFTARPRPIAAGAKGQPSPPHVNSWQPFYISCRYAGGATMN
jgi:hypothetical protein